MNAVGIAVISLLNKKWAFEPLVFSKSSVDLVFCQVQKLKNQLNCLIKSVFHFVSENSLFNYDNYFVESVFVKSEIYNLLEKCVQQFKNCDHILFLYTDHPLNNFTVISNLLNLHLEEMAEYSFTEGYPKGIGAEILDYPTLNKLKNIARDNNEIFQAESIKRLINFDVNQYDVEVLLSEKDFRADRLDFICDYYRNYLLCQNFLKELYQENLSISMEEIICLIDKKPQFIRTVPSYIEIEITNDCNCRCKICPRTHLMNRSIHQMTFDSYKTIIDQLKMFAHEFTLCFGFMGEPLLHSEIIDILRYTLSLKDIDLIIETNGIFLSKEISDQLINLNDLNLKVIISIDTPDREQYKSFRDLDELEKVEKNALYLLQKRPRHTYLQILRLKENEAFLDKYYQKWNAFADQIILQKYNFFNKKLKDLKGADLSPLNRHFGCVHLKRDLVILSDGTVAFCKQDINGLKSVGNVFKEKLENQWNRLEKSFIKDYRKEIDPYCKDCDEWFTYNT